MGYLMNLAELLANKGTSGIKRIFRQYGQTAVCLLLLSLFPACQTFSKGAGPQNRDQDQTQDSAEPAPKTPKTKKEKKTKEPKPLPVDGEEAIPRKYKTIYIHNFTDSTFESGLTGRLKQTLTVRFSMDKRFKVESDKQKADLWLFGNIDQFEEYPVSYDQFGEAERYRYTIVATVWVRPNPEISEENLFDKKTVRFDTMYQPRTPPYENEFTAKERLLNGLSNRILKQVVTGWYSDLKTSEELGYEKKKKKP